MPSVHEQLSAQFHAFEIRGRGWQVHPHPTTPEPPFQPFLGYRFKEAIDDGHRPTFLSSLLADVVNWLSPPSAEPKEPEPDEESDPDKLERDELVELQVSLPADLNLSRDAFLAFLSNLSACTEPVSFELLGQAGRIFVQFAIHPDDVPHVQRQLAAYFPQAEFLETAGSLTPFQAEEGETAVVEFGLEQEFILPLASGKLDPFIGLVGAFDGLAEPEVALFQVIFQRCRNDWPESIRRALTRNDGAALFVNRPELMAAFKEKLSSPLSAAVVRLAVHGQSLDAAWQRLASLAAPLGLYAHPAGNELIPLRNDDYPYADHVEDVVRRQSRRSGMILNATELSGFVHLPSADIRTGSFQRLTTTTRAAPESVRTSEGLLLGTNVHAGRSVEVRLPAELRTRHMHVLGVSGTGKSTFLFNLVRQDILNGQGVGLIDPHGDLIDRLLGEIPEERIKDVVLLDAGDEVASVGFNILSARNETEKTLLASDLVSVFQRLSSSWGDQMEVVLRNALLAFLDSSRGGTLVELSRFLVEPEFRKRFLTSVSDPKLLYYWQKSFPLLSGTKSIGPITTRLEMFLATKPLLHMVAQQRSRLDFADIMDTGKIFLARLSLGAIGRENAFLLGSLFMARFQQTAMARQRLQVALRKEFWLYVDEFQNFITPSVAEILSGTRKYRLGLTLAHHDLQQLERDREVASALDNAATRVVFRVGDDDARKLDSGFASFSARDLQNLDTGQAVVRVERSDADFNLGVSLPEPTDPTQSLERRSQVVEASRSAYATPRVEVEALVRRLYGDPDPSIPPRRPPEEPPSAQGPEEPSPGPPPPPAPAPLPVFPTPPPSPAPPPAHPVQPPKEERLSGRGGVQHKHLQERLKEEAEKIGFIAAKEKSVLERTGWVDLALEGHGRRIAVEITITTTVDHEVGNVLKGLKAGFDHVAVVAVSPAKLDQLRLAIVGSLGADLAQRVGFYLPDDFLALLSQWQQEAATTKEPPVKKNRGWVVKTSAPPLTPEEIRAKEDVAHKLLADAMKQARKKKKE